MALTVWPYLIFLTSSPLLQLPQYSIALFFFFPFLEHILIQVSKRFTPFLFLILVYFHLRGPSEHLFISSNAFFSISILSLCFSVLFCFYFCFFTTCHFPDNSVGGESACNTGDLSSIPGLGRSPGEGIVYPIQYS